MKHAFSILVAWLKKIFSYVLASVCRHVRNKEKTDEQRSV